MRNNKALSDVVVWIIGLALTLVIIVIAWTVISGLVQKSAGDTNVQARCLNIGLKIDRVNCTLATGAVNSVKLSNSGTKGDFDRIRLVFSNDTSSVTSTVTGQIIGPGESKTATISGTTIGGLKIVSIAAEIANTDGTFTTCTTTDEYTPTCA